MNFFMYLWVVRGMRKENRIILNDIDNHALYTSFICRTLFNKEVL